MKKTHRETGYEIERSKSHLDELEVKYLKDYFEKQKLIADIKVIR